MPLSCESRKILVSRCAVARGNIFTTIVVHFLLFSSNLHADVYHIHHLSEKELLQTYTSMMLDACHHADQFWHDWPVEQGAGYWGSGRSDNMNEGIRAISGMVLTSGALLKYDDALSESDRNEIRRKAIGGLRYAVASHRTGPHTCTDGKPWGNSWQSAMWTCDFSFGAWLMWDDLDADLRKDIERVVAFESDRFLGGKPPAGSFNDTKAEENGWNLVCLALAATMFPDNPHAKDWNEKAIEYAMNTLSAPQDANDKTLVDGRPVNEWFCGANVHPDFTLENHGFFHPGYVGCSSYFLTQTAMYYTFAHRPVPEAAMHHLMDEWKMFQGIILPNGEAACPQGMDWELHGLPYINLFASLACREHDALAARMENVYLQYMRAWQVMCHGDLTVPGSRLGFTRHAICAEQATYGFLAHKIFGPAAPEMSASEAARAVEGVHLDEWVQVVTHRTMDKFVSFSWTNRIMGMVIPIGPGHEANPDFTVPFVSGFVGGFDLKPRGAVKTSAIEHTWKQMPDGFETTGIVLLNGGRLKQKLRMTSIGEKTVLFQDRVTALKDVSIEEERGIPMTIENDDITGGKRTLYYDRGETVVEWKKIKPARPIPGSWINVDGRLGLVEVMGSGIAYNQAGSYQQGMAVYPDALFGSFNDHPRQAKAGEEVVHRVIIISLETSPKETAKLAKSFKIVDGPNGQTLHFKPAGERELDIPLL